MELTGKVIAIMEAKSGTSKKTGNQWMKQEYVLEIPGVYPRHCMFSLFGEDKIKQFDVQMGDSLTVQFEIDARESNGKWYNDVKAYNVIKGQDSQPVIKINPVTMLNEETPFPPFEEQEDNSVLPF